MCDQYCVPISTDDNFCRFCWAKAAAPTNAIAEITVSDPPFAICPVYLTTNTRYLG
jgi:hypothetical protein